MDCRDKPGDDAREPTALSNAPTLVTTGLDPVVHADLPHKMRRGQRKPSASPSRCS